MALSGKLVKAIDVFVPPAFQSGERGELARARALATLLLGLVFLTPPYLVLFYLMLDVPALGNLVVSAAVIMSALLALLRRGVSPQLVAQILAGMLTALVAGSSAMSGGFGAPAMLWVFLTPMIVTLLCGVRRGAWWTLVSAANISAFYLAYRWGVRFPDMTPAEHDPVVRYVTLLMVQVFVVAVCFFFERLYMLARSEVREEREFVRSVFDADEGDRKLVAYDIHDAVIPLITAAGMRMDASIERLNGSAERETLAEARRLLSQSIAEARRILAGLRSPVLDELGVAAAIESLAADFRRHNAARVVVSTNLGESRFASSLETSLFRICQEALTNVSKHSQATEVTVDLMQVENELSIVVRDNGRGFTGSGDARHFGLRGIQERARVAGGKASVASRPGLGTTVSAVFTTA